MGDPSAVICSRNSMASDQVSSPVLHPATQTRKGCSGLWPRIRAGMVSSASRSNTLGSRKKLVTLISRSVARWPASTRSRRSTVR